jgi:ATP-dependent DNA helicase RecQ
MCRPGAGWTYDAPRYAAVAQARRDEAQGMLEYEVGRICRMRFLAQALDDPTAHDCGRCDICAGVWWNQEVSDAGAQSARQMLAGVGVPLDPRASWPSGMAKVGVDLKGRIPQEERVEPGRVIARLTDLGPGQMLREFLSPAAGGPAGAREHWEVLHPGAGGMGLAGASAGGGRHAQCEPARHGALPGP